MNNLRMINIIFLFLILIICLLCLYTNAIGETALTAHFSSPRNLSLLCCDNSVYYLENHRFLFGCYSVMYRFSQGKLSKIKIIPYSSDFMGVVEQMLLLRLSEVDFKNFPYSHQFQLFDTLTNTWVKLPEPIEKHNYKKNEQIRTTEDNIIFVNQDYHSLFYYSFYDQELIPVFKKNLDFVGYDSSCIFAKDSDSLFYIYGIDGKFIIKEIKEEEKHHIMIRLPNTHLSYYIENTTQGCDLHQYRLDNGDDMLLYHYPFEIQKLMISADNNGQYLYFDVQEDEQNHMIKRYDIEYNRNDNSFEYHINIQESEYYISEMLVQDKMIFYITKDNHGNQELSFMEMNMAY